MDELQAYLQKQQELMEKLVERVIKTERPPEQYSTEFLLDKLAPNITEFCYDPDNDLVFDSWYTRYEDLFLEDGKGLDDAARVRLLLRKLSTTAHDRYINYILPLKPRDNNFDGTVKILTKIFGKKTSLFNIRSQCLKITKATTDDFIAYAGQVNKACERFNLSKLSEDQFKCLIFVSGLQASKDNDIRIRILAKLEADEAMTLDKITEECQRLANIKHDAEMIACKSDSAVHAVSKQKSSFNENSAGSSNQPRTPCWSCGGLHYARSCTYKDHKCAKCSKTGHKDGYCNAPPTRSSSIQSNGGTDSSKTNNRNNSNQNKRHNKSSESRSISIVNKIDQHSMRKYIPVRIDNTQIDLQFDTASDITIISESTWKKIGSPTISPTTHQARGASGQSVPLTGEIKCSISTINRSSTGICFISKLNGLDLLGIDWIEKLQLWDIPISSVCNRMELTDQSPEALVKSLKSRFPSVFTTSLGKCSKTQAQLTLKPNVKAVYRPRRPTPYAVMLDVEAELNRLVNAGIISPVDFAAWAAPIVVVRKANGKLRICGDYSTGLNDALESHQYPLPLPEGIFATLSGGVIFSQLDLADAYLQIEVDEQSRQLLAINTHRGLFVYNSLPFGVKSAPGIFQQIMDQMLAGVTGAVAYLDDIVITGRDEAEHHKNLLQVLERIKEYGFTLNITKCKFSLPQIKYLGCIIDKNGRRPDPAKIEAIQQMPPPTDVSTLRSFLGGLSYYGIFIKNMRKLRQPLDELLKKNVSWNWSKSCQQSFDAAKETLRSDLLLTHFNPALPIVVAADASMYGIGAVLLHRCADGSEKAVCHASRALSSAEKAYSQIEKEALGIIFAVEKFHKMIYGRSFTLQTDHKPLLAIFGSNKGIPVCTANRIQRWALKLLAYNFKIEYLSTNNFGHADMLSRLINNHTKEDDERVVASVFIEEDISAILNININAIPVTFKMIENEMTNDTILQDVIKYHQSRWPESSKITDAALKQFYLRRESLSIVRNCLMYGERLVVPEKFHQRVLRTLHKHHPGIERMKSLARSYVYWPFLDKDVETMVRQCEHCILTSKSPVKTTLASWPIPERPWQRIHLDYAGPMDGLWYLIIVDAFSKWPEVYSTKSTTSNITISFLKDVFSRFGNPETIVSDNGSQFNSDIFKLFCIENNIQHLFSPAWHPQSNGQAERFVDTFKRGFKKLNGEANKSEALQMFLKGYRSTPNPNTPNGKSPADVMLGRPIRIELDSLRPPPAATNTKTNTKMEQQFNRRHGARAKSFAQGTPVHIKIYKNHQWKWTPGTVLSKQGKVCYNVDVNGKIVRTHANQMRNRHATDDLTNQQELPLELLLSDSDNENYSDIDSSFTVDESTQPIRKRKSIPAALRRSTRIRRPVTSYFPTNSRLRRGGGVKSTAK